MRIYYDGLKYHSEVSGGIKRYFNNLIRRLPPDVAPVLVVRDRPGLALPSHPALDVRRIRPARRRWTGFLERRRFGRTLARSGCDLVHPTYYLLLSGRPLDRLGRPVVVTVWDLIHERFPQVDPSGQVRAAKRRAVAAAAAVLCISEHTRQDLLATYPVDPAKVRVAPLASELAPDQPDGPEPAPAGPYFLYVGSRDAAYKNFDGLLRSVALLSRGRGDARLCLVGPPLADTERRLIHDLGLTERVLHAGAASDAQLVTLYRHAVALVYPSLYEGFGIPLLEAMSCGTAVVASRAASLPEVAADAAVLVDARSPEAIADGLRRVLEDAALRANLIARGRRRAAQFSWDRTAAAVVQVYRELAG